MRIEGSPSDTVLTYGPVSTSRDLVVVSNANLPVATGRQVADPTPIEAMPRSRLRDVAGNVDVRHTSPREVANLSLDLYLAGFVEWDEYAMLAFQPELHPDFDKTIGALTGERARPDVPRDYVEIWEDRLAFEKKYSQHAPDVITKTEKIVGVFHRLDSPVDYDVVA